MKNKLFSPTITTWSLVFCFVVYVILSWILVFRDPRALIGIGNLYPELEPILFPIQSYLTQYGLNSIPTILFVLISLIAIVFYIKSLSQTISMKKTIIFICLFGGITFISFPVLSTDIFSYIMSERVSTVHDENIWQVTPASFPDDQFAVMADWKDTTSVYGGIHYLLYLGSSLLGQDDLVTLVILYKVIPTLFAFGTLYVLYLLLKQLKKNNPERMMRLVFWNPLFVLEIFGSGHNDSMMLFFALLGLYFYYQKRWLLSGIILALAVQIKLIPIVLFAFLFLTMIWNKRLQASGTFLAGFLGINALIFSFMQVNVIDFLQRVAYNGGVYWQSLPNVIQTFSPEYAVYLSMLFFIWLLLYIIRHGKKRNPVHSYVVVILVYLLFISAAYWNWYVLWVLPFIPFITDRKVFATVLVLSITSLFAYPLLWVIHRINTPSDLWSVLTYLCIFGPPILTYVFAVFQKDSFGTLLRTVGLNKLIAEKA